MLDPPRALGTWLPVVRSIREEHQLDQGGSAVLVVERGYIDRAPLKGDIAADIDRAALREILM